MPTYCFACPSGHKFEKTLSVMQASSKAACPECKQAAERDFAAEHGSGGHHPGNWPLLSDGAGVHPDQIGEAYTKSVRDGVPTQFTKDGRAIFTSALHRKRYCESVGLFDRSGGYSDPRRMGRV